MSLNTATNNKRIAKNTILLYLRMFFLMFVNLYISRVVLIELGAEDFGIYNVVGGIVAMFSILSASLSAAITRFLNFEMGKGNTNALKSIFSAAINIQFFLSLFILILAETAGLWFVNHKMIIPAERLDLSFNLFCTIIRSARSQPLHSWGVRVSSH